jgi:hypothetical protein
MDGMDANITITMTMTTTNAAATAGLRPAGISTGQKRDAV